MTILLANKLPDKIRGCLKTWFVEPKANVYVSNLNDQLCQKIVSFLSSQCTKSHEFILMQSTNRPPGYKIVRIGKKEKRMTNVSGLDLFIQ